MSYNRASPRPITTMKQAALNLMKASGLFAPFRFANRKKTLILMYHRFSQGKSPLAVSAREFERQLDYFQSRYRVVPLSFVAESLLTGRSLPSRVAVITIDDGYRDAYEIALPILKRRRLPATLFVVTDFVDGKLWLWTDKLRYAMSLTQSNKVEATVNNRSIRFPLTGRESRLEAAALINEQLKLMPDGEKESAIERLASELGVQIPQSPPDDFAPLAWNEVREMDSAGIEIGSHTLTHPILTQISGERLRDELTRSRERLERELGRKVESFCYPNGNLNEKIRSEVKRAGYTSAVTTEYGFNDDAASPLALSRIPASGDLARFAQSTSGFEQFKMRLKRSRTRAATVYSSTMQAKS